MSMNKIRIYELAKLLGRSNAEIVSVLEELGVKVKSHMSSIDVETADLVEKKLSGDVPELKTRQIEIKGGETVSNIAALIGVPPAELVRSLVERGHMLAVNAVVSDAALSDISARYSIEFTKAAKKDSPDSDKNSDAKRDSDARRGEKQKEHPSKPNGKETQRSADERPRPPIVTVMGHVDHGKTTLLDFIRKTRVTEGEAGGITQHIGAYKVIYNGNEIVFLDTPGHEAFTAMRARGAGVTDIAVLVVAADDGVMPQTLEAMNHAKAAGVPVIVAVNKVDKPEAKPDRVRQQLSDHGLVPEEWGGDTIMVDVAAKTGQGIDQLLEMLLLVAEMAELRASEKAPAEGVVVEANLDKGKGPVATIIVQRGTLKRGMILMTQTSWGKIRAMLDDTGKPIDSAGPSTPVEILGLENVPMPGEVFKVAANEREARDAVAANTKKDADPQRSRAKLTLEELYDQMQSDDVPQLNIVLKCDVQGSLEAFHSTIMKMSTDDVRISIVHEGVGRISESDVTLASVSNAIIIGFNVRPDANAKKLSEAEKVQIRLYSVIYDMQDDIRSALEGMLTPTIHENIVGQAEIRATFKIPKVGKIAGCFIQEGHIRRNTKVRVLRDDVVVWEGGLSSLRHFKDEVREIASGNECGMSFASFQDFHEGDIVEAYEILTEKKTLE